MKKTGASKTLTVLAVIAVLAAVLLLALSSCGGKKEPASTDGASTTAGGEVSDDTTEAPAIDPDADSVDGIAIRSADDLKKIGSDPAYPLNGDYVLVTDIDLSGQEWTPIGGAPGVSGAYEGDYVFSGTFEGRGHKIRGLHIEKATTEQSYWGFFGSVGSANEKDPAVIKNIVFANAYIYVDTTEWTGVGILAGQVNGCAEIDSIALLSGSVTSVSFNSMNIGTGSLLGQCRTDGGPGNSHIKITNIYSAVNVTCNNYGIDMGGGVLGRIRGSNIAELSNVLYTGSVMSENVPGSVIASGDSTADKGEKVYYLSGSGEDRNMLGRAAPESKLTNGTLSLSDQWDLCSGRYPLLKNTADSLTFGTLSMLDFMTVGYAAGDSAGNVNSDFTLPENVIGMKITWKTGDRSVISVSGGTASVTRPSGDDASVTLTGDYGSGKIEYTVTVKGKHESGTERPPIADPEGNVCFLTTYIEANKPIVLGGYAEGTKFTWIIEDLATGIQTTKTTTEPTLTLTESNYESRITVRADGYEDITTYFSYLPIVNIESKTQYQRARREYYDAEFEVLGSEKYKDNLYDGKAEIRLRGNSTADLNKKPFKVKLDKKADLLGLDEGGSKHWVLLANARDPSLIRNKVLMDFSGAIGTEVWLSSESVTLIYNGEYCGVYQLSEHVRVGDTRVNVFDWENYAEDVAKAIAEKLKSDGTIGNAEASRVRDEIESQMTTDWSWMQSGRIRYNGKSYKFTDLGLDPLPDQTGGFLLEMDFYHQSYGDWASVMTAYAQPLYFNTPEPSGQASLESFYSTDLYWYTYDYIQSFEYAIHSNDFVFRNSDKHYYAENWWDKWGQRSYVETDFASGSNDGKHYSELFDMDSLVQNFIFCEIAMNWDSMKNSFFVYKDVDGLAKIGPQWDFDWAWGNETWKLAFGTDTWAPEGWHCTCWQFMVEQYYQEVQWNCLLIRDPYFLMKVYEAWNEMRYDQIEGLVGKGGTIDTYSEYIRKAAAANDALWANADAYGVTFDQSMDTMREFISIRMNWLDEQFKSFDTFVNSFGVYHASDKISAPTVNVGGSETTFTVNVNDGSIKYVKFQVNGTTFVEAEVKGGKATATVKNSALESGSNCVVAYGCDGSRQYVIYSDYSIEGNYNQAVSNYAVFSK